MARGDVLTFTSHERAAYGAVAFALGLATIAEVVGMHLVLSRWSETAAWIATALGLYGLVWIVADYRSVRRTPHSVEPDRVRIRRGKLWRADIPMDRIREVRLPAPGERGDPRSAVDLHVWLPAAPWVLLGFDSPQAIEGPYGITRKVSRLGLSVDDPEGFRDAVHARMRQTDGADPPASDAQDD